jgi:hypothetical protein
MGNREHRDAKLWTIRQMIRDLASDLGIPREDMDQKEQIAHDTARDCPLAPEDVETGILDVLWSLTQLHTDLHPDDPEPWTQ